MTSWLTAWTQNFCPNPSVETSTNGYNSLLGTESLYQDPNTAWAGQYGLRVTTPGSVPGEGVSTPPGTVVATVTGAMSVYVYGETGTLTVQAVQNPGGAILGTFFVQLDGSDWQRVILNGLSMTGNDTVQLLVFTTSAQALTFWIDAVQYEPESPAHPYIDGDQLYCTWTGTPELSTSYQQYQFPVSGTGTMQLEGYADAIFYGETFSTGPISGNMDMSGYQFPMVAVSSPLRTVIPPAIDPGILGLPWEISGGGSISGVTIVSPGNGFSDFAIFTSADPDPAMVLIGYNNAGTEDASNTATSWAQLYGTFSAPLQSLDSEGNARWQAAAYMAAGFRIASQAPWAAGTPNAVNFAQVQVEKMTQQGPTDYQLPRALSTIVKPTNMNYVTNPSFETSTAGWTVINGATITQTEGTGVPSGSYYAAVSVPSSGGGVYTTVSDLIVGDTYTASAYVADSSGNINDITIAIGGESGSAVQTGTPYGSGTYGSGPFGGAYSAATDMGDTAYRPFVSFTATASTMVLSIIPTAVTGATYPLTFNLDAVMVSPGEVLTDYADGSSDGWEWELGGTENLSRSYYYERQNVGATAVQQVLDQHIPLGISAYAPQFYVPATQ